MRGRLNKRITIQKRTVTKVKGVPTESWDAFYSCSCTINSLFGTELYKALDIQQENVLNFTIRYAKALDNLNTKEYRVMWGTRFFNIIATDYYEFMKEKITIKAREVI
jgi:SPP1 family predicted phage head-tail adaptor